MRGLKVKSPRLPAKKSGPKGISEAQLKAALKKNAGVYALAARDLGCDRSNVRQRVENSPALQRFIQQIDDEIGDVADGHIKQAIIKGDLKTIRWYAPLKMRDRGFNPRLELSGPDGAPLQPTKIDVTVQYIDAKIQPDEPDDA